MSVRGRVLRISDLPAGALLRRARTRVFPLALGLCVFLAYPSLVGFQDVAALSADPVEQRWLAHLREAPGKVVFASAAGPSVAARPVAADPAVTGSISAERDAPSISTAVGTGPRPQRVNRERLGDRVVSSSIARPPAYFSAGSVLERQSILRPRADDPRVELAFVRPRPVDEAFRIAGIFHRLEPDLPPVKPDLPVVVASLVEESLPNVVAFREEPEVLRSPFAEVLNETPISLVPKIGEKDHDWAADPLPQSVFGEGEQHCLTAGIYFEARGEPVRGQAAVAQVILNRVRNPAYPDTVCGVVYQNKEWRNRCQFSFACDRIKDRVRDPRRWKIAQYVARETSQGRIWLKEVGSSTHYHATYVRPRWARTMEKVSKIGLHVFYRTFGGGWS